VAITGIGLLSPAGNDLDAYWRGITCGRSAIGPITLFDPGDLPVRIGGEVAQDALREAVSDNALKRCDRSVVLGEVAAERALRDAGLGTDGREPQAVAVLVGSGLGPCFHAEEAYGAFERRGWRGVRPATVPRLMFNVVASRISMRYNLVGGHQVVAAACASSSLAMAQAYEAVRWGREETVLTGGCDSPFTPSMFAAWVQLRALSRNPDPARACRPFDRLRDGLVLSEGAAMFVFEEAGRALRRGARIYAEVLGAGTSSDARHLTQPDARGQALAISNALHAAGLGPSDVDYINAHGTSTPLNDLAETQAIKMALAEHARRVPISSTKSVIGHALGASGALELVAAILAIRHQVLPPTVNLDEPDPECDLDYVPHAPRPARVTTVLNHSFAFGGSNCVLVVRKFEGPAHG